MPSHKNFSLTNTQLGEMINPLSSANGINLTASSTVGGIVNLTSTVYKNTTNSFSFGGVFSLPSWTTATILRSCLSAGTGYQLEVVGTTGKFKVTLNSTVYESTIPGGGSLTASNLEAGSTYKVICVITVGATTTTVSFYIDGYLLNTTSAQVNVDVTNTNIYYTGGLVTTRYAMTVYDVWDYNRALDSDEVLDLCTNGINYADKWGGQTWLYESTYAAGVDGWSAIAGTVTVQDGISDGSTSYDDVLRLAGNGATAFHSVNHAKVVGAGKWFNYSFKYYIPSGQASVVGLIMQDSWAGGVIIPYCLITGYWTTITGRSLTTVYGGNLSVVPISSDISGNIPMGTGEYIYVRDFKIAPAGITLALESEGIQPAPGQWLDSSTNKLHALQPLTGSSLTLPKRDFQVRGTVTWSGSHELKYITGIDQAVLPPNAYIESIIGVITGSTIEDIQIGDGSDGDRFVALTTGLSTGTVTFTIANHITDGINYKLTVDPDANFTGSIVFTIIGYITS